jgi:hypothetical protein
MTRIVRDITVDNLAAVGAQHTQPFNLVEITFESERVFLSEGPEVTFAPGGDVIGDQVFIEGRVTVSSPSWTGEGVQSCTLEILNENNYAAALFIANRLANASVRIWAIHRNPDNSFTDPDLYFVGSCENNELSPEALSVTLTSNSTTRKFFPNQYMGSSGFSYIPPEGAVVFWNSTSYVLERDYG